jgi:FeS assembly SUF system regulator
MLRLNKLTDYAVVVLSHMAHDERGVHAATEIAHATGVGFPTVSKLLKLLARSGVVHSVRGAKGGYRLNASPERISMAEVIQAIEGPIALTECSISDDSCQQSVNCEIRGNWTAINQAIKAALEAVSLSDLACCEKIPVPGEFTVRMDYLSRD